MHKYFTYIILLIVCNVSKAQTAKQCIEAGWQQLIVDNDTTAIQLFNNAYQIATQQNDIEYRAHSLLHLGMASYGSSLSNGIYFTTNAIKEYKKMAQTKPEISKIGHYRCLQILSTIKAREGKLQESIALSHEAIAGIKNTKDTSGTLGIIYSSLGQMYKKLKQFDSSYSYHQLALNDRITRKDLVYLSASYSKMAELALLKNQTELSKNYYQLGYHLADSTNNRQSKVSALIGLSEWHSKIQQVKQADSLLQESENISSQLSDKTFLYNTLLARKELSKQQGNFQLSLQFEERISMLKDALLNWEKERIAKNLAVQYDVADKEQKLALILHEKQLTQKVNYLLLAAIFIILLSSIGFIRFLGKINKKDKQLLKVKEDLEQIKELQRLQNEQKLKNDIEFKESQLTAMTLQMLQKSELLVELKEKLGERDGGLTKLINIGLGQEKEWAHFNQSFESINKNFNQRLKEKFPEISPNELRICALIKMNLSIKEMAVILSISPDSVKTARYRLRKKLQLNTEDNLTDFILSL